MFTRRAKSISVAAAMFAWVSGIAFAQVSAITYQGRLNLSGNPLNATADFEFSLWDAEGVGCPPVGGTRLGSIQTTSNVQVADGFFTVQLNGAGEFGANAFTGGARWVQVAVRSPSGSGAYVTLCPRQPVTAVPYALYAVSAPGGGGDTYWAQSGSSIYNTNNGNVGIGTQNPTNRLSVSGNADVSGSFAASTFTGNGAGLTALNASNISTGTIANARTTGVATNTPNTLVLRDASGNFAASTITGTFSGNGAALTALNATNIATGNLANARLPVGGAWALTSALNVDANTFLIDPATDRVGLGISAPEQRLHLYSNVTGQSEILRIESRNFAGIDLVGDRANLSGEPGGAFLRMYQDGGGVGETVGVQAILGLIQNPDEDGSGRAMTGTLSNSLLLASLLSNGAMHFGVGGNVLMTLRNTGRLGLGTNAPARMLHLRGAEGLTRIDRLASSGGASLMLHQYGDNAGTEEAWKTFSLTTFGTGVNNGRFALSDLGAGVTGNGTDRFVIDNDGNVGLNIPTPAANLHVRSIGGAAMNTLALSHNTTDKSSQIIMAENNMQHGAILRYDGLSNRLQFIGLNNFAETGANVAITRDAGWIETYRYPTSGGGIKTLAIYPSDNTDQGSAIEMFKGDGQRAIYINAEETLGEGADITLYNGSGVPTIEIDAHYGASETGRVRTQVLEITGGSDFSEQFDIGPARVAQYGKSSGSHAEILPEPGLVVCIDPESPGKLIVSTSSYDRTVAGVISGAGGVRPGMIMGQSGSVADGEHPVALSGRVYVWCDASGGAITPGDLLTTSATPGHAMRVEDHDAARGAIIGKAMTSLSKGEQGLVLVLVSLQ